MKKASAKQKARAGAGPAAHAACSNPTWRVLIVAAVLLVAAVLTNLPGADRLAWPRHLFQALLWAIAVAVVLIEARVRRQSGDASKPQRSTLAALGVVALFAVASHYHFGRFHGDGRVLHYHEQFHYTMGSKYFPELGYDRLYAATQRALLENAPELAGRFVVVRNLRSYRIESAAVSLARSAGVARAMAPERWQSFRDDVRFFQSRIRPAEWENLFVDHGYNATPFWNLIGSTLTSRLPLNDVTLALLAALDLGLIVLMLALVMWAFGAQTGLLFAIFFFANAFATFDFTGGGFLRQLWLAGLIGFVCGWQRNRPVFAGVSLAVAALDRAFPLVFLLLPTVLVLREVMRKRTLPSGPTRLLAAFAGAVVLLGGWTLASGGGLSAWQSWRQNIQTHNRGFYTNQIALRNLFVVNPLTTFEITADGWDEARWWRERETLDARSRNTLLALRVVLLLALAVTVLREPEWQTSLGLVAFTPFLLFYPANYYYAFLVAPILCWRNAFGLALAVMALQGAYWLLGALFAIPKHVEFVHWLMSLLMMLTFLTFLGAVWRRNAPAGSSRRGIHPVWTGVAVAGIVGGIVADGWAAHAARTSRSVNVMPQDVRQRRGAAVFQEIMAVWGPGWARDDHLAFQVTDTSGGGTLGMSAPRAGPYRVRLDYTKAPPFGTVSLSVNGTSLGAPVNLFWPSLGKLSIVHDHVPLRAGENDLAFAVVGRDPAAAAEHFAIDRIVFEPAGPPRDPQAALNRAVAWVRAHPADDFDGGRNAVAAEILALYGLLSDPALVSDHARYRREIQTRLRLLDTPSTYRPPVEEFDMLVAAAYVAGKLGYPLEAFKRARSQIRQHADTLYAPGPDPRLLLLCAYLNRLEPNTPVPCDVTRSVMYHEHAEGGLFGLLAGDVDRTRAPSVSAVLALVATDVFALTDFGRADLPDADVCADRGYWAELCEHALRWGRETGDVALVARVLQMANCLGVAAAVPARSDAIAYLVGQQDADGSFGVTDALGADPVRPGVLAAIGALTSDNRRE